MLSTMDPIRRTPPLRETSTSAAQQRSPGLTGQLCVGLCLLLQVQAQDRWLLVQDSSGELSGANAHAKLCSTGGCFARAHYSCRGLRQFLTKEIAKIIDINQQGFSGEFTVEIYPAPIIAVGSQWQANTPIAVRTDNFF